ncbi:phage tail tape measure protein [Prevotella sp.]|uniref:phage tail tape measure protein n=1 Tax=Prevotella sp. TaxID=59823 RepID=UPI0025E72279|nr:phage tail tape measure protein [Prevotella sp.]
MATQKLAKVVITANASTAKKVLEEIDNLVQKYTADIQKMTAAGQANTAECKRAESTLKALSQVQRDNIEDTKRLGEVVQDLTNTKLRDLRRAMGSGKSALAKLTGSDADLKRAEQIRGEMKQVGDQMRLIEGQYVKIADGLKNVSNQSDQWLDKAIKQQRDLVGSLQKSDASYQQNLATLKQLEAEEDRRKGKMGIVEARQTVTSQNASASDLRRAKSTLTEARDNTPTGNTGDIAQYNKELQEIEKRLEAVSGKAQKASMSWKQMKQVLAEPNRASGEDIKHTMEVIQQKIQQLPAGSKYVADLRRQYSMLEQTLKGTRMSQSALNDILTRSKQGKASLDELRRAYKQLEEELNQINTKSKEFADKQKSMKELKKNIDEATGAANKHGSAWQTALKNLTAYVGLFAMFNQLKTYFIDLFRLNMKYSEQLTNIRKVALSTTDEVANLSKELAKIDTRTSIEELNNLAYAGAKLGITTQNLAGFVRAADQVNVALKEDLGDEALTALAKITEVMGLADKYGVEQAMLKTGSAIFRLASTSTATSGKIVDFSNRMLALGEQAALTTPDILALGAAVDSMALEPEVAATAFGKLVVELRKGTSPIEKSLGIASGSLKKMIESGRGMDAILTIFRRMGETKNLFALDGLFKDLGSDGARLVKTMVTMAAKNGMLTKAVKESNKAFNEGSAVTVEYNMQQETAAAYMERANNLLEKQFVSSSAASGPIRDIAKAWFEVVKELTTSMSFMTEVRVALALLFASIKMLLSILPTLITMISMAGLAGGFAKLLTYVQGLEGGMLSLGAVVAKTKAAFNGLSFAKQAGIMGGLIGLLGILVVKLAEYSSSLNGLSAGQRVLNEVQEEGKRKAMEEQESLKRLHNVMHDTSASMNLRLEAMNKLNGAIPNLNAKINTETGVVKENTKAWEDNFQRLQDYYELEGARSKLAELGREKVDAILDLQKKEDAYANTHVNAPNGRYIQTSGGAMMPGQAQGAIGQAGQRAAAKRERDKAQSRLDEINAQEEALRKKFGAKLDVGDGKVVGQKVYGGNGGGGGNTTTPEDDARNNISEFITKIKNFYKRQMTATVEDLSKKGVEKELQEQAVNDIQIQMDAALAAAQQSIVLGNKTWDKFKKSIDKYRKEKDDEFGQSQSRMLENAILNTNVAQLRSDLLKQMPKIKKGQVVGYKSDERDRAYLDRMWLNASSKENDSSNVIQKRIEQRRKELLEHDYTGVVQQNSFLGLISSRFADVSLETLNKDRADVIKVLEKARTQMAALFETNGEKQKLLQFLFGKDYMQMPSVFLALMGETEQNVKLFYHKLIQYVDEYTAAQKKEYDESKKISDFLWKNNKRNLDQQAKLRKMQQESNLFGKRTNFLSNLGLADLTADPEVELLKMKMQMAEDYYAFCLKNSRNKQLIDEADKARQEAELAYANQMATAMKNRLSQMQQLVQPIETFGAEVGKAFALMESDVSSAQESIKNALKSMIESWANMALNDVNTQMWKAINDAGAKQGKKNAQPGIDAARANANVNAVKENFSHLGTADNPMHVIVENGFGGEGTATGVSETTMAEGSGGTKMSTGGESSVAGQNRPHGASASPYVGTASQAGTAIAETATGGTTLSDAVAGIGGSLVGDLMNTKFTLGGSSKKTGDDKEKAKQLKKEKKHQKELSKEVKKGAKDREKETHQGVKNITDITDAGNKEQSKSTEIAQNAILDMTQTAMTTNLAAKEQNNQDVANSDAARTNQEVTFSIAGAMAKCFEFLGPIAGPIAAAGVMATLMGLLQWALNSAFSSSSKKSSSVSKNTKLVSGMLTYDSGNVQDLKPFVADNGEIYWATEDGGRQKTGVQMISTPRATTINGQPSLVAENGPEIVIGRETTHAMMMNNPALLKALVNYDSNYSGRRAARRAFDNGNVGELASAMGDAAAGFTAENGNLLLGAPAANNVIANNTASQAALLQAVKTLLDRLNEPIYAKIDMYGRGNLYDSMTKANQFMKGKG